MNGYTLSNHTLQEERLFWVSCCDNARYSDDLKYYYIFTLTNAEKYPEIKKLMGPDPWFKYIVSALVIFQIISSYYISKLSIIMVDTFFCLFPRRINQSFVDFGYSRYLT